MEKRSKKLFLIVDSNILFSYFLLSDRVRRLIESEDVVVYSPDWALYEINKYFGDVIVKKAEKKGISREELELLIMEAMEKIIVVPKAVYMDKFDIAYNIAKNFDVKDTPFVALALKLKIPIWTNDKDFIKYAIKSGKFLALNTEAIEDLLKGKSLNDIKNKIFSNL